MGDLEAQRALNAYAALLALDPNHAARQELLNAQVPARIVENLYPGGFIELELHLIDRAATLSNEHLLATGKQVGAANQSMWKALSLDLQDELKDAARADDSATDALEQQTLFDYLSNRLGCSVLMSDPDFDRKSREREKVGICIAQGTWNAHWLMSSHARLPQASRLCAENLMLAVAATLEVG